jgi:hypothetical protein
MQSEIAVASDAVLEQTFANYTQMFPSGRRSTREATKAQAAQKSVEG